nr:PREDICTED: multidrug resistance-associated protein 4 isoform X2 [Tribolium castaneum]|eukprot:XP_015839199.1 PREDICTED: multidrug resistance-associated protein 4 isoform X2 [Tribolium castaneum]
MESVLKAERKKKINTKSFFSGFVRNEHLCELPESLKSRFLSEKLEKLWFGLKPKKKKPSIIEPLLKCHFLTYFFLGLTQLIVKTLLIVGYPFLIDRFFGISLVVLFLLETAYDQWYMFKLKILQLQVETALCGLIYRKSLKLPQVPFGKILTFMTKDCHNLNTSLRRANDVWIYTLQSIFLIYLIFRNVGLAVLVPLFCFLIILPQQIRLALKSKILKTKLLQTTDSRFKLAQTVLPGIKSVKLNKAEAYFGEKLHKIRLEEVGFTHKLFLLKFLIASNASLWICASFFPWTAIFLKDTSLAVIFYLFQIYQILGHVLLSTVPFSISQSAQTLATIARIDDFLQSGEVPPKAQAFNKTPQITLKGVTVAVNRETVLRDISLDLRAGLHQVIGAVGSGKSFLLKTILGECRPIRGEVLVQGSCSYSAQKPWVFASTVRENIVFGENFDEGRYNRVLHVCSLQKLDLDTVQSLSQGQKAKINLARAIYKNCDVYLLDDPLAGLDYATRRLIFQKCAAFLRGKLVIFAAREMYDCANCVVLEKGKIICFEKFDTINENFDHQCPEGTIEEDSVENASEETQLLAKPLLGIFFEEKIKLGRVDLKVYKKWTKTSGFPLFIFVIFLVACLPPMAKIFDSSLTSWNTAQTERKNVITRHIALFTIYLIFVVLSTVVFLIFAKKASIKLHKLLSQAVLNADLAFFDKNLSGQILGRFSHDLLVSDEVLPFLFYDSYIV